MEQLEGHRPTIRNLGLSLGPETAQQNPGQAQAVSLGRGGVKVYSLRPSAGPLFLVNICKSLKICKSCEKQYSKNIHKLPPRVLDYSPSFLSLVLGQETPFQESGMDGGAAGRPPSALSPLGQGGIASPDENCLVAGLPLLPGKAHRQRQMRGDEKTPRGRLRKLSQFHHVPRQAAGLCWAPTAARFSLGHGRGADPGAVP